MLITIENKVSRVISPAHPTRLRPIVRSTASRGCQRARIA
jgi:hypothetical protein